MRVCCRTVCYCDSDGYVCGPLQESWARSSGNVTVQYFLLIYALSMTNIRYTSFCLEHCHHLRSSEGKGRQDKGQGFSFLDMFVYIFYFPVFFSGPLMTYDQFYLQVSHIQLGVCVLVCMLACVRACDVPTCMNVCTIHVCVCVYVNVYVWINDVSNVDPSQWGGDGDSGGTLLSTSWGPRTSRGGRGPMYVSGR